MQQSRVRLCLDDAELLARLVLVCVQLQLAGLAPAGRILPLLQQAARDVEQLLSRVQVASLDCNFATSSQRHAHAPALQNRFIALPTQTPRTAQVHLQH